MFLLQSAATVAFGIDFRNVGIRLLILEISEMFVSYARLLAFGAALSGMVALYLFLSRSYTGTAIRAIAQDRQIMPLMGSIPAHLPDHLDDRRRAGRAGVVPVGAAIRCAAVCRADLWPDHFPDLRAGGLGNMIGGFFAAFLFAEIISVAGLYLDLEWGYVFAFGFFVVLMFIRPQGLLARRS